MLSLQQILTVSDIFPVPSKCGGSYAVYTGLNAVCELVKMTLWITPRSTSRGHTSSIVAHNSVKLPQSKTAIMERNKNVLLIVERGTKYAWNFYVHLSNYLQSVSPVALTSPYSLSLSLPTFRADLRPGKLSSENGGRTWDIKVSLSVQKVGCRVGYGNLG